MRWAHHRPFLALLWLALLTNFVGSAFNLAYNYVLLGSLRLPAATAQSCLTALWVYNAVAYPLCLLLLGLLLWPSACCLAAMRAGRIAEIDERRLHACRRTLLNLPFLAVLLNLISWLPGAVAFPLLVCEAVGWDNGLVVWQHFGVSFAVAAVLTAAPTFFLIEGFLMDVLYPDFFAGARPAEVTGVVRIGQELRQWLFWVAVGLAPVVAVLAVALNFSGDPSASFAALRGLALVTGVAALLSSGVVAWVAGRDLLVWLRTHEDATRQIAEGNDEVRIGVKRPDEFGVLSDGFNDMAEALGRARHVRETFGQFVRPDVRDEILDRYPGLGGTVQEVTVLFLDIRGFTRRSAGESAEQVVELLNEFFSLAATAVERRGGWVNKFLGDGVLALFGTPFPQPDHADRAVQAALDLLSSLRKWNDDLKRRGRAPLRVGGGIHTGPALVGCVGATLTARDGRARVQREFTAIGETINVGSRIEQLTKSLGTAVLLSERTHEQLTESFPMVRVGPQRLPGYEEPVVVYQLLSPQADPEQDEAVA